MSACICQRFIIKHSWLNVIGINNTHKTAWSDRTNVAAATGFRMMQMWMLVTYDEIKQENNNESPHLGERREGIAAAWKSPETHKSTSLVIGKEPSLMLFIHSLLQTFIHFQVEQKKRDNSTWHFFIPINKVIKTRHIPARWNGRRNVLPFCTRI